MTVHVLMPVFNRLTLTRTMVECLRAQETDENLRLIVIDDGSTDGTAEYLQDQQDIIVLAGDGNLWWGGAIDLGVRHLLGEAKTDDWILLVNNDTKLQAGYIQSLLDTARERRPAAVGSVVREEEAPHRILSVGPALNSDWFVIRDKAEACTTNGETGQLPPCVEIGALSGRGVLYPVSAIRASGGMRPAWLPHYLADYELSLRVKKTGCSLLVDTSAVVYSKDEYGNTYRATSLKEKFFSVRSPFYLPAIVAFWWSASSWQQRLTAPVRLLFFLVFPGLRRARK